MDCDELNAALLALWGDEAPTITSSCDAGLDALKDYDYPAPDPMMPGDPCPPSHPGLPKATPPCTTLNNLLTLLHNPLAGLYQNQSQCSAILSSLFSILSGLASPIVPVPPTGPRDRG
jgi:hypothetical protein